MDDAKKLLQNWRQSPPKDGAKCEDAFKVINSLGMTLKGPNGQGHFHALHDDLKGSARFPFGSFTVNCHAFGVQGKAHPKAIQDIIQAARIIEVLGKRNNRTMKTTPIKTHLPQNDHNSKMISYYPVEVTPLLEEEGSGFQALFPPLARSVVGYGMTQQEAIADLQALVPSFLELMEETGQALPEVVAEKEWDEFSGKFNVRVAKMLHAQLVELAEDQGVSLNSLVQTVLASGATALAAGKMFGALERPVAMPKSPYHWDKQTVQVVKVFSVESYMAQERTTEEWSLTQEG